MGTTEYRVTKGQRIAATRQIGISEPFSFLWPVLSGLLLVGSFMSAVLTQEPWFLVVVVLSFTSLLCTSFMAYEDYSMLNGYVIKFLNSRCYQQHRGECLGPLARAMEPTRVLRSR